jgi:thioredoxin-like negative regulator of GroEL
MKYDIIAEPVVRSPGEGKPRRGRGFSRKEIEEADITVNEARDMGLIVDLRRRTAYPENVEALKEYEEDLKTVADELVEAMTPSEDVEEAIKELSSLSSVKKSEAMALVEADIKSLEDLAYCDIEKASNKTDIDPDRLTKMVEAALKKI